LKIAYFVHDLSDATVVRRVRMLQAGGAQLAVAGFRRTAQPASAAAIDLGRTYDGRLGHRAALVARQLLRLSSLGGMVGGADVILARNLEMLALAAAARRAFAPRARLVYECLDIHRALCDDGAASAALRAVEAALLGACSAVVVSAPAFTSEYFAKRHRRMPRILLVENKVLAPLAGLQRPAPGLRESGPPWRIGWFGQLRCRRSVALLKEIARRGDGAIEVVMRGRPSAHYLPDLESLVAGAPHVRFEGPYAQGDLARIYAGVHFAWSVDLTEQGLNSDWLLPNRIYEGTFFNTPSIAERGKAIGAWLAEKGTGLLVDDVVEDTLHRLQALAPRAYAELEASAARVDTDAIAFDAEGCRALVAALDHAPAAERVASRVQERVV